MATAAEVEFWKDMCRKESARNNKLRSEWNEAIRQQLAADDARKTAEAVASGLEWEVEELSSENAKLRELVRDMVDYGEGAGNGMAEFFANRMRELGVGVDE